MIKKILKKINTVLDNTELLRTFGTNLNRGFIKELLVVKKKLNIIPSTIIDVGAAFGEWTLSADFVFPYAKIYSFEPIEDCYLKLKEKTKYKKNIEVYNYALFSNNEIRDYFLNEFVYSSSLFKMNPRHKEIFPSTRNEKIIKVLCQRFDSLEDIILDKCVYVKIDVQGAELSVLNGFGKLIDKVHIVQIEINFENLYDKQSNYKEISDFFFMKGFKSFYQLEPFINNDNQLIYCDCIFLR